MLQDFFVYLLGPLPSFFILILCVASVGIVVIGTVFHWMERYTRRQREIEEATRYEALSRRRDQEYERERARERTQR